ncbi:hypothetical protein D9756_003028 [Leucocoprinus leucothites]|uniref:Major facilitator superfamily (MFS) profile domain-containing protein n=1 Tax=Leucocoprinus leucothites TaxID=201217 RepID=A0A8H5LJM2_9AGAR|nr:hypothetical protein D9756_003028 [Leucoagaricus leucothites]
MEVNSVSNESSNAQPHQESTGRKPLPIKQLLIVATVLLTEPLTNSIIRSFDDAVAIPEPSKGFSDEDTSNVPLYSQFLESSLFLAKAATVYQWGKLSDKLGRRPILLMGPLGLGLSTIALGVTDNAWVQTTARSMQGVFGGNLETTKTVIAEITDNSNRHRAYAALPLVQSVGISIGSSVGNSLVTLGERLPVLERIPFIQLHPLFIPCTIAATFSFFSFHLIYHGFKETLPAEFQVDWKVLWSIGDRARSAVLSSIPPIPTSTTALLEEATNIGYGAVHRLEEAAEGAVSNLRGVVTERVSSTAEGLLPTDKIRDGLRLKELISLQLIIALLNYAFISFLDQAQQTLLPMMYTAPIAEYGLGLSPEDMTKIMAKWGSYNTLAQLLLFPWLLQRFGPKKVYATCLSSMVFFFASFPMLHLAATYFSDAGFVVQRLLSVHMGMSSLVYMAYGCSQMFIMDAVPDRSSFGTINGIGQSVGSSARMFAPPMVSLIYTLSLNTKVKFGGYLLYAVLVCITVMGSMISALLPRQSPVGSTQ